MGTKIVLISKSISFYSNRIVILITKMACKFITVTVHGAISFMVDQSEVQAVHVMQEGQTLAVSYHAVR